MLSSEIGGVLSDLCPFSQTGFCATEQPSRKMPTMSNNRRMLLPDRIRERQAIEEGSKTRARQVVLKISGIVVVQEIEHLYSSVHLERSGTVTHQIQKPTDTRDQPFPPWPVLSAFVHQTLGFPPLPELAVCIDAKSQLIHSTETVCPEVGVA